MVQSLSLVPFGMQTGQDGTDDVNIEKDKGKFCLKMLSILCSTNVERVVPGGEVERKISQISSHGTTRSTVFRHTKRGTERLVPFRPVSSHVPNGT